MNTLVCCVSGGMALEVFACPPPPLAGQQPFWSARHLQQASHCQGIDVSARHTLTRKTRKKDASGVPQTRTSKSPCKGWTTQRETGMAEAVMGEPQEGEDLPVGLGGPRPLLLLGS